MNYRHTYHAGNVADVLKHAALLLLIRALQQKDGALTIIDTHAGRGLYDLQSIESSKTNEADHGIIKAFASSDTALADYRQLVAAFNPRHELRYYPGSPAFLTHTARPQDIIVMNEKHPDEAHALKSVFAKDKQVQIHTRDGYELWQALTPTKTSRGLVFVDPPYEQKEELQQIADTLAIVHRKWAHGVSFIWYPIKERAALWRWEESLRAAGITKILQAEHMLYDEEGAGRFNGSGIIVINPPYTFSQELPVLLESIRKAVSAAGHKGRTAISWLDDQSKQASAAR